MRSHVLAFVVFFVLTIVMTFPLVTMLDTGVRDHRDCLLNAWILSWDVRQLSNFDLDGLFDANIFYPHSNTLAYSEHLLPQALVAMIPLIVSGNPILAHNIVFLFSILSTGFCMYLYGHYLTRSWIGGVVAGIIFAFSPFMFGHLSHVQIFAAAGIPLAFLLLARFFAHERWGDLLLLGVVVALQLLANGYYAVYLSFFFGLTMLAHLLLAGKLRDPRFLAKIAVLGLVVAALAGPVLARYVLLQRDTGFRRKPSMHAELSSFLITPEFNRLYGDPDRDLRERWLFPGVVAVALAAAGLTAGRRRLGSDAEEPESQRSGGRNRRLGAILKPAASALGVLLVLLLVLGGPAVSMAGVVGWLLLLVAVVGVLMVVDPPFCRQALAPLATPQSWRRVHIFILVFAFLCSFGLSISFPYPLLYEHVPGFDGLRALPRIHVFTMFSLATLAAMGMAGIAESRRRGVRRVAVVLLPVLIVVEFFSAPLPLREAPVGERVPEVFRWLAQEEGDGPVLELPLPQPTGVQAPLECPRMFFSAVHWKPIVNGYSGFNPPLYNELRLRWVSRSAVSNIADARRLGVRYLVLDLDRFMNRQWLQRIRTVLGLMGDEAVRAYHDDTHEVWQLAPPGKTGPVTAAPPAGALLVGRDDLRADASIKVGLAGRVVDGDLGTCWNSGTADPGSWIVVDLGRVHRVGGVTLGFRGKRNIFPRGYSIELSRDGKMWHRVASGKLENVPIESFLTPTELQAAIAFPAQEAHHIRISNTAAKQHRFWALCELEVWR